MGALPSKAKEHHGAGDGPLAVCGRTQGHWANGGCRGRGAGRIQGRRLRHGDLHRTGSARCLVIQPHRRRRLPQGRDLLWQQLRRQHPRHRWRCPLGHDGTGLLHHWLHHRLCRLCNRHRLWCHRVVRWGRRIGLPRPTRHGRVHLLHSRNAHGAHRGRRPWHCAGSHLRALRQQHFRHPWRLISARRGHKSHRASVGGHPHGDVGHGSSSIQGTGGQGCHGGRDPLGTRCSPGRAHVHGPTPGAVLR
mmetsp:Transcript_68756/g.108363  ORF Transcript_68756/g.108363 Transcript_68756/m.108363 type:complete len:248 (-) Transcript_68756:10-753(-)